MHMAQVLEHLLQQAVRRSAGVAVECTRPHPAVSGAGRVWRLLGLHPRLLVHQLLPLHRGQPLSGGQLQHSGRKLMHPVCTGQVLHSSSRRLSSNVCVGCVPGRYGASTGANSSDCTGPCDAGRWGAVGQTTSQCSGPCDAGYVASGSLSVPTESMCARRSRSWS